MDLDVALSYDTVRSEVLSFEVHVDRHGVLGTASTYGRNEVDRGHAATLLNEVRCVFGNKQIHATSEHGVGPTTFRKLRPTPRSASEREPGDEYRQLVQRL